MQGGGHLLIGAMPKFSGDISPLLNVPIKLHHLRCDVLEQVDAHPKTPLKISLGICRIFIEIHPHQLVVAFNPFPPQLLSTKNRTTNFLASYWRDKPIAWRCSLLPLYRIPRSMNRTMSSTNMYK
jgi:hypothetical protein